MLKAWPTMIEKASPFPRLCLFLTVVTMGMNVDSSKVEANQIRKKIEELAQPLVSFESVEKPSYVGMVIGTLNGNDRQIFSFGKTHLDRDTHPTESTYFEIGSITKVFTGLLLAGSILNRKVSLDDPYEKCQPNQTNSTCFDGKAISLRHLVTHTAGFPRVPTNLPKTLNPYDSYDKGLLNAFFSDFKLSRSPGEKYEYSNIGMGILGQFLAERAGKNYFEVLQERILAPLGMNQTRVQLSAEQSAEMAQGYLNGFPVPPWKFETSAVLTGAGGLKSNLKDMIQFAAACLETEKTPLQSTIRLSQDPLFQIEEKKQIGMAWQIDQDNQIVWHDGGTFGFSSFIGLDRERKIGVVMLANSLLLDPSGKMDSRLYELGQKIIQLFKEQKLP